MLKEKSLSSTELKKRLKFRCVHRHNGLSHSKCFDQAQGLTENVYYLDIETSNLNADFGIILTYCMLSDKGELLSYEITPEDLRTGVFDYNLCKKLCEDLRKADRVIGYYSERFDIPFIRTRCLFHKLDMPTYLEVKHTDAWKIVRKKLKLHSNRLGVVAPFFGIEAKGHPLNGEVWLKCLSGNKDALDFVLTHNKEDVYSLKKLWHRIQDHQKLTKTSI